MPSDPSVFGMSSGDQKRSLRLHKYVYPVCGIFAIIVVTVLSGYFTYDVVYNLQVRRFKRDYNVLAASAGVLLRKGLDEKIQGARALSAVISGAFPLIDEWPFVYLNNYYRISTTINPVTQISFAPIVTPSEASKFEEFAYRSFNQTFSADVARESFGIGIFAPVNFSCNTCGTYHDVSGNTSYGSPNRIMVPILQGNFSSVMLNMHSDELRGTAIDKVIECAHNATGSTEMESCGAITTPTFTYVDPSTIASIVFYPVFPVRNATSLGGMTVIGLKWNEILDTLFPATVSGVFAVLRADTVAYTFVITNGRVSAVMLEDAHEEALASYARAAPVTARGYLQSPVASYTLTFYPTLTFWREYVDDGPLYTALIVVFVVLAVAGAAWSAVYFLWMRRKAADSATMAKAKRLFIRYISHEIRTPLNTVSLGLNLLLSEMNTKGGGESALKQSHLIITPKYDSIDNNTITNSNINSNTNIEWRRLVAELIENSQCAVMLLDDLLSFEQLETTRREQQHHYNNNPNSTPNPNLNPNSNPIEMQVLPVWDLVRLAVSSFSVRAKLSDVSLVSETEIDQGNLSLERRAAMEGLRVLGNEAQLRRVVGSLLGNALQYSHEGGEIHVTTCWIEKEVREKDVREKERGRDNTKDKDGDEGEGKGERTSSPARRRSLSRLYLRGRSRTASTKAESSSGASSWNSDRAGMSRAGVVRVAVTDQGAGMTPEQTAQVFGKGQRFSIHSLQAGQGTGIGLFVCKIIAEQHHASIRVTSPGLGLGSTYILDLPVFAAPPLQHENSGSVKYGASMQSFMQQPLSPRGSVHVKFKDLGTVAEEEDEMKKEEEKRDEEKGKKDKEESEQLPISSVSYDSVRTAPQFTNKRILVVDDAPSNRKMLIRVLAKSGHLCEQAQDGQVALDMVDAAGSDNPYDMILMDYEMPVMNGPTATRLLRERGCTCPIVGVTGNVLSGDVEFFVAQGADAVLPKPLQMAALDAVWRRKMEEEQQLQQDLTFEV